jgi:membrane-bound lytic murein transglycosylase D
MKKIILLVLIFFSICAGCFAQEAETDAGVVLEEAVSTGSTTTEETEIGATEDAIGVPEPVEGADEQAIEENSEDGPSTSSGTTEPENTDDTPALEKKPLSLEYPERAEIERFRKQYLEPKWTKVLYDALENAIDYRLYIRKALADAELPPELEYLPIVESNYKTNAKSRSGALGLWQFMTNSVRPFLTLNDYVDERLDPWKETDAAIKKLKENYNIFGDWFLAIGAYNCGAGAMTRALAKAEEKDFWYLCDKNLIPSQTQLYVPKLLAIADLALNTEYFEIDIPDHEEEYEALYNETNAVFDYITVNKAYSIAALAQNMRIDTAELKRLNPSFVLGFTHPSAKSAIRLPAGTEEIARAALETMEPMDFPIKYTVVSGDSLWSISRRYGCTVSQICELNGIQENAILKIGKILYIPSK